MARSLEYLTKKLGQDEVFRVFRLFPLLEENPSQYSKHMSLANTIFQLLLVRRDNAGKTLAEEWESEGWTGLNNDERVLMSYRRRSRPALLEVQRPLGPRKLECIDLLSPEAKPFTLLASTDVDKISPQMRLVVWLTEYPSGSRISSVGTAIIENVWPKFRSTVDLKIKEAQAAHPDLSVQQWYAEHMCELKPLVYGFELNNATLEAIYRKSPRLNGLSPKEAATDPAARPLLIEWMRGELENLDRINSQQGTHFEINAVLDELGIPELKRK